MTLHQRIAEHLKWSAQEVRSFSLASLRAMVTDQELKADISKAIASGDHLWGTSPGVKT